MVGKIKQDNNNKFGGNRRAIVTKTIITIILTIITGLHTIEAADFRVVRDEVVVVAIKVYNKCHL
jgi:hypothetical protein